MTTTATGPKRPMPVRPNLGRASSNPAAEYGRTGKPQAAVSEWDTLASHREAVVKFLRRRCRDVHQAEDLAHDTLLRAARYTGALAHVSRPRAWIVQIAVNVQRDVARKDTRMQLRPPSDATFLEVLGSEPIPGDDAITSHYSVEGQSVGHDDLSRELNRAWGQMKDRDRRLLEAYYADGGTTQLAAEAAQVDRRLVKVRLFRARRRLETELRRRMRVPGSE